MKGMKGSVIGRQQVSAQACMAGKGVGGTRCRPPPCKAGRSVRRCARRTGGDDADEPPSRRSSWVRWFPSITAAKGGALQALSSGSSPPPSVEAPGWSPAAALRCSGRESGGRTSSSAACASRWAAEGPSAPLEAPAIELPCSAARARLRSRCRRFWNHTCTCAPPATQPLVSALGLDWQGAKAVRPVVCLFAVWSAQPATQPALSARPPPAHKWGGRDGKARGGICWPHGGSARLRSAHLPRGDVEVRGETLPHVKRGEVLHLEHLLQEI